MRAILFVVMTSSGCAFITERENLMTFVHHHGKPKFYFSTKDKLKTKFFLNKANWEILLVIRIINHIYLKISWFLYTDILWPVLRGSQPLQETAHLQGEDH
jgi:hypothetical protein